MSYVRSRWVAGAMIGLLATLCGCNDHPSSVNGVAPAASTAAADAATAPLGTTGAAPDAAARGTAAEGAAPQPKPKAVTPEAEVDLGFHEASELCAHDFVIRNEGDAPLTLESNGTSCRCTLSELPKDPIPPGGQAVVHVTVQLTDKRGFFAQMASVKTNDPDRKFIELKAYGSVKSYLSATPDVVTFNVGSEARKASVTIYSQVWDKFTLEPPALSETGLKWKIEPATAEQLKAVQALSGYVVEIEAPADAPPSGFHEVLRFAAKTAGAAEGNEPPHTVAVDVGMSPAISFTLAGPDYDPMLGTMDLGVISQEKAHRRVLLLKINDLRRTLNVERITIKPSFLKVEIHPADPQKPELGMYKIEIEIPSGAPEGGHSGMNHGEVTIDTDHPVLKTITIQVHFTVVPA